MSSEPLAFADDEDADGGRVARGAGPGRRRRLARRLRGLADAVGRALASSLTRRIVVLNLAGLVALLVGVLYLNQFRQGLIEARVQSLFIQGEIIAGAIAASATIDTDAVAVDPDRLLQQQAGDPAGPGAAPGGGPAPGEETLSPLEFPLNPERVGPLLRRLVTPTRTRARVFDREGGLLIDSRAFYARGDATRTEPRLEPRIDMPPVRKEKPSFVEQAWRAVRDRFVGAGAPAVEEAGPPNGRVLPDVQRALGGARGALVRKNDRGETIVSVAVPIQRGRATRGVLLLSTQGGDIDGTIASERFALLQVFLIAALVMIVLSLLLAGAIAGPVRRLAEAAERVRLGIKSRQEIPDFTRRSDEIGHLSGALRDMTAALYGRLDAIETFAADVSHELKNPLTSLRSAVETMPLAKSEESRGRLMEVIQHDVRRLDRLISDIADASRLDAELARADAGRVDMARLLGTVVSVANERRRGRDPLVALTVEPVPGDPAGLTIIGHDSRLGQVVNNLIDNARSFSKPDGSVRVRVRRIRGEGEGGWDSGRGEVEIVVDDDGPGIPPHALERIFERFYTDRPEQGFGQNSGLGLSISRQIVVAHRGSIRAENRPGPPDDEGEPTSAGARFRVRIPAATRFAA